jgi:hypothetical protein
LRSLRAGGDEGRIQVSGGNGIGSSRLNSLLVDITVPRRPAVGRTEFTWAFLTGESVARHVHASFPALGVVGLRDDSRRRLHVGQARRALVDAPDPEPGLPTAVRFDPDALS